MMPSSLTREITIHENERAWLGKGFSKTGLLPSDRGRYSTSDGSLSWKSISEASEALLETGWTYVEGYENDGFTLSSEMPGEGAEEPPGRGWDGDGGWRYARDFSAGALKNWKKSKGAMDWVRYRKLVRKQIFDPLQYVSKDVFVKCDHCDSEAVDELSNDLLEAVSFLTMIQSSEYVTAKIALPLKAKVIELLDIGKKNDSSPTPGGSSSQDTDTGSDPEEENNDKGETSTQIDLVRIRRKLETYIDTERTKPTNMLSRISSSAYRSRHNPSLVPNFDKRCEAINDLFFTKDERDSVATLFIKDMDVGYHLHCDMERCGESCRFARKLCGNSGCGVRISGKHMPTHDAICPYKIVSCELNCGDEFQRKLQESHMKDICPHRKVHCPFEKIGCVTRIMAKDVPDHVETQTDSHLLLAVNRMMEYQNVIKDLNGRIKKLEEEKSALEERVEASRVVFSKEVATVQTNIQTLEKKVGNIDNTSRKEFKKIRDHSRERRRREDKRDREARNK